MLGRTHLLAILKVITRYKCCEEWRTGVSCNGQSQKAVQENVENVEKKGKLQPRFMHHLTSHLLHNH